MVGGGEGRLKIAAPKAEPTDTGLLDDVLGNILYSSWEEGEERKS